MSESKIDDFFKKIVIRKKEEQDGESPNIVKKSDLHESDFFPDLVISIDGSCYPVKIENGFPGAEIGCITVVAVFADMKSARQLAKNAIIDPKKFRKTENSFGMEILIPGCNVLIKEDQKEQTEDQSPSASMRRILFNALRNSTVFPNGETLLETYEALLRIRIGEETNFGNIKGPIKIDVDEKITMTYGFGKYDCPHTGQPLYSSDATRLHELLNDSGTSGDMYGQIMNMFEKLVLMNILRTFEKDGQLQFLQHVAFIMDGPLACFGICHWLSATINAELSRINELQKKVNGKDLLVLGIEKSGNFYSHFENVDTTVDGASGKFPAQSAFLLNDKYIRENIVVFKDTTYQYGKFTYFGRKIFYKTKSGHRIVASIATFDKHQRDLLTAEQDQFPRLADVMNLLDELVSSRYPNSLSPLVSAHAEASIPLNLSKRLFSDIIREFKDGY
jgi:hypothetical protein